MIWLARAPGRVATDVGRCDATSLFGYPSDFFTNGGMHPFHNFEEWEDTTTPSIEDAFKNSINLALVRVMYEIRQ